MHKILRTTALASVLLLVTPLAYAAGQGSSSGGGFANPGGQQDGQAAQGSGGGGPAKAFRACRDDAQTFCKGVQPGGGRIKDCLWDHYKEISDDCYDMLKNAPDGPPPDNGR